MMMFSTTLNIFELLGPLVNCGAKHSVVLKNFACYVIDTSVASVLFVKHDKFVSL